jgi:K+-transporting ATPase A subunit
MTDYSENFLISVSGNQQQKPMCWTSTHTTVFVLQFSTYDKSLLCVLPFLQNHILYNPENVAGLLWMLLHTLNRDAFIKKINQRSQITEINKHDKTENNTFFKRECTFRSFARNTTKLAK